jgi:hypothetical protein
MRLLLRIERLEAKAPTSPKRIILLWIGRNGRTTKAGDTDPHLPDGRHYDSYRFPYLPGGGLRTHASQTN